MNGVLMLCNLLASWTVIGAVESEPGWITIDYFNQAQKVDYIVIEKPTYLQCISELQ